MKNNYGRKTLRSIDDYALAKSHWARQQSDDYMFNMTMEAVGDMVKDEVKLGTLYATLVLATPGEEQTYVAKEL